MRKRLVVLAALPTVILGLTYFFLVEYVLREYGITGPVVAIIRFGGAGLILLFTLGAFACAAQISELVSRPLRALVRIAEGSDLPPGDTAYLPDRHPALRFLFMRVHTLVQQNRSGAQTLSELEALRREVDQLRQAFRMANERREIPSLMRTSRCGSAGELTQEIGQVWSRIQEDLLAVEESLRGIAEELSEREARWARSTGAVEEAVRELERLGHVWSLEVELARRDRPGMRGALGSCFEEFSAAIKRVKEATRSNGDSTGSIGEMRSRIVGIRKEIGTWLPSENPDQMEEESSAPMRGTE